MKKETLKTVLFFTLVIILTVSIHFLTAPIYR